MSIWRQKRKYRCGNFPSEKTDLALPWIQPLHTISLEQTIYNLFNAADIRKFIKKIKTTTEDERLAQKQKKKSFLFQPQHVRGSPMDIFACFTQIVKSPNSEKHIRLFQKSNRLPRIAKGHLSRYLMFLKHSTNCQLLISWFIFREDDKDISSW